MPVQREKWDPDWGELSEAAMRQRLEEEGYRVHRYLYPPGTVFDDHTHTVDKKDSVLIGRLKIGAEGREFVLGPGDMIEIPVETLHNAAVVGTEAVVSLDATRLRPPGSGGQARPPGGRK